MKPHETFVYGLQILFGKLWDETSKKQFFYYNNDTLRYCSKDWNITWYRYLCLIPILCGFTHISRRWWLIIEQLLVCHRRWSNTSQGEFCWDMCLIHDSIMRCKLNSTNEMSLMEQGLCSVQCTSPPWIWVVFIFTAINKLSLCFSNCTNYVKSFFSFSIY